MVIVHGIVGGLADRRQTDCASSAEQVITVDRQSPRWATTVDSLYFKVILMHQMQDMTDFINC